MAAHLGAGESDCAVFDHLDSIANRIQGVLLWPAYQAEARKWRGAKIIARVNLFLVVVLGLALLAWITGGF